MKDKGRVGLIFDKGAIWDFFLFALLVCCLHTSAADCRTRMGDMRCYLDCRNFSLKLFSVKAGVDMLEQNGLFLGFFKG